MMNSFSALGGVYDEFNDGAGYDGYIDFICDRFQTHSDHDRNYQPRVVDLGCGTGEMSLRLAQKGFDVVGVDRSPEMLMQAMEKASDHPELALFFIRQDMRALSMDAKANLFISCYDCLNYLDSVDSLKSTVDAVARHTVPGGVFIFDLNTYHRFRDRYGDRVFVYRKKDSVLLWENHFNEKTGVCSFEIEVFQKQGSLYARSRERHKQRYFSEETVTRLLKEADFDLMEIRTDNDLWHTEGEAIKKFFVAKKK